MRTRTLAFEFSGMVLWLLLVTSASADDLSVWDGAYTEQQATAGQELFVQSCVACHADGTGAGGGHSPAPSLIGSDFAFRWVDSSIADLLDTIRQTMPEAAPNSLSSKEYAAVTAYVLQLNGFPSGALALDPEDRVRLQQTYIDESPP